MSPPDILAYAFGGGMSRGWTRHKFKFGRGKRRKSWVRKLDQFSWGLSYYNSAGGSHTTVDSKIGEVDGVVRNLACA